MADDQTFSKGLRLALALIILLLTACGSRGSPTAPQVTATPFLPSRTQVPIITPKLPEVPAAAVPTAMTVTAAATTAPAIAVTQDQQPSRLEIFHHSGQTFITWPERQDASGEIYRIYRSNVPINAASLSQSRLLAQVGKNSAQFYANRYHDADGWKPRLTDRYILQKGAAPLKEGVGLLVWTLSPEDFGGGTKGAGYYAVTVTLPGQGESLDTADTGGPVEESVQDPLPVEITYTPGIHPGPGGHFYIQYMDLRSWNATFHAPNPSNEWLGMDPKDPNLPYALAYAYDYSIFEPTPEMCGGKVPDHLPVMVYLHGWRNNRYSTPFTYDNPSCAYGVYPIDESQTWYFGFARDHDFRQGGEIAAGDVIENYTERRVLRMVYDLMRDPPGPAVDQQRVYVIGQSMGGTGALAFAERYPNVFAAAYSGQPITNFRTAAASQDWPADVAIKWGKPELNLPVNITTPGNWAAHLQKYNGVPVWDWENFQASLGPNPIQGRAADDMAPFGIDHGSIDPVIRFDTQAQPLYPLLNSSGRTWAGAVIKAEHTWTNYGYLPPALGKVDGVPFWGYQVKRDETVPGFSNTSTNDANPPAGPTTYNLDILWSASWTPWDGPPVDQPNLWQMSFCTVEPGAQRCGSAAQLTVDVTLRRIQQFVVKPGVRYDWQNISVRDGRVVASGTVIPDQNGLLTVKGFAIKSGGNRLVITRE